MNSYLRGSDLTGRAAVRQARLLRLMLGGDEMAPEIEADEADVKNVIGDSDVSGTVGGAGKSEHRADAHTPWLGLSAFSYALIVRLPSLEVRKNKKQVRVPQGPRSRHSSMR
jgi:hypothetical protein